MPKWKIILWLTLYFGAFLWSGINPHNQFVWFMEALPGLIAFFVLYLTYQKFQFTEFTYWLILLHAVILFVGAHYTYSHMPLFDYIKDYFDQSRNNYDKLAHIAQGFIPAIMFRELLIRLEVVKQKVWIPIIVVVGCLGFSALYEIIEWTTTFVKIGREGALMSMQGYAWDSQTDMLAALIGASAALVFFSGVHDRAIAKFRVAQTPIKTSKPFWIPAFIYNRSTANKES